MARPILRRTVRPRWIVLVGAILVPLAAWAQTPVAPEALPTPPQAVTFRLRGGSERLQMIVNTSRILTIGQKIPQAQVNDPQVVTLTALSPTEVQISAKKPGVTQVNLWGEDQKIYTLDLVVFGDSQELNMIIRQEFPTSTVRALTLSQGVLLTGFVDQPEHIARIVQIAEQFYKKDNVLNNIRVGGVQLVHLHVKVMEVSRTKLRTLGFDWAKVTNGNVVFSSASTLLTSGFGTSASAIGTSGSETFGFGVTNGTSAFFGVLEALRKDSMMKILADPTLVTVSGRAAYFHVGGKFPYLVPQGNNAISIDWMPYGTRVDFVPIVLGNGRIHLDVRPEVSEPDTSLSVTVNSSTIPGVRLRTAETGVEMSAGQTLAIAGLLSSRDEATNRGLPWVSELPYIGALFRRVEHSANDIELLILVTPELIEAVDNQDVPPCGPGMRNARPNDCDLYLRGHLEVPDCCSTCNGAGCDRCNHGQLPPPAAQEPGMILEATQSSTAQPGKTNSVAARQRRGITVEQVTTGGGVDDSAAVKTARSQGRVTRPATTITAPPPPQRPSTPTIIGPIGYEGK